MNFFSSLFSSYTHQLYLDISQYIDCRVAPKQLIKSLENKKNLQKFIKALNCTSDLPNIILKNKEKQKMNKLMGNGKIMLTMSKESVRKSYRDQQNQNNKNNNNIKLSTISQLNNIFDQPLSPSITQSKAQLQISKRLQQLHKLTQQQDHFIIRRISICHLLLIYSQFFYQSFLNQIDIPLTGDQWLNQQWVKPYVNFMKKCCMTYKMYEKCKKNKVEKEDQKKRYEEVYQMLFYCINMLKIVLKPVEKIRLLGKFYKARNQIVFQNIVEIMAIQAKQLYFTFKNLLTIILTQKSLFLSSIQSQSIIKNILLHDLAQINQQMKMLLLGKQFYPYGRAIGIKLFRIQQSTSQLQKIMNGIITDHCETNRKMQKQQIQGKLFGIDQNQNQIQKGQNYGFNVKYFEESLTNFGLGFGKNLINKNKKESGQYIKRQEETVLSSQDDENENDNDEEINERNYNQKLLVDTNQSNMNKEDNI